MRQAATLIARLNKQWGAYRRKHHYNRPHLFLDKDASYFHSGPLVQRPLKLKLARDAVDRWMLTLVLHVFHILRLRPRPANHRFPTPPPHRKTRKTRPMHLSLTSLCAQDRDTMAYEDDMSRLVGRYLDAQIRRKDYDRCTILAARSRGHPF